MGDAEMKIKCLPALNTLHAVHKYIPRGKLSLIKRR